MALALVPARRPAVVVCRLAAQDPEPVLVRGYKKKLAAQDPEPVLVRRLVLMLAPLVVLSVVWRCLRGHMGLQIIMVSVCACPLPCASALMAVVGRAQMRPGWICAVEIGGAVLSSIGLAIEQRRGVKVVCAVCTLYGGWPFKTVFWQIQLKVPFTRKGWRVHPRFL